MDSLTYSINIPGCSTPGRMLVAQRKDPFVVNLGETFDLVNFSNPLGPPDGGRDVLDDANVTAIILELPKECLRQRPRQTNHRSVDYRKPHHRWRHEPGLPVEHAARQ